MVAARNEHIATGTLLDCAETETLSPAARTHVERCDTCQLQLDGFRLLLSDMRSDRTPPPPEAVVARAAALFEAGPSLTERLTETTARLLSRLVGSPGLQPALGVRGGAFETTRLRFEGEALEVDVEVTQVSDGTELTAQVLCSEGAQMPLLAWAEPRSGVSLAETPVPEHGQFALENLPEGPFDLVLELADRRLRLQLPRGETPGN